MKLCSRLLVVFDRNFSKKRQIWATEPKFGEAGSDARPWLMALWKAMHVRLSIRVNWSFSLSSTARELRRNVYSSAVFTGSRPLCTQLIWTGLFRINRSWHQKARGTGLPDSENRIFISFLFLTQYRSVTMLWCDRQTEGRTGGRTDRYYAARGIYNACKVSFAVRYNKNY